MQKIILAIFLLISHQVQAQNQMQLNQSAELEYKKVDQKLNETYKKVLLEYSDDTLFIKNLKASQRLWIKYRDAEILALYPNREAGYYGSAHPMCRHLYLTELTQERIKKLMRWLEKAEEGELCNGSIKTKE